MPHDWQLLVWGLQRRLKSKVVVPNQRFFSSHIFSFHYFEFSLIIKERPIKMPDSEYAPGIPIRVADYANIYKKRFEDNATTPEVELGDESESRLPVLPLGIERKAFDE